ncbi:unnamed protein product [Caenorhabditis sp. 36 PRJEB53466]|nr:unnamed protein product [Caenorhabditis sp. 36 PRJEB53466]
MRGKSNPTEIINGWPMKKKKALRITDEIIYHCIYRYRQLACPGSFCVNTTNGKPVITETNGFRKIRLTDLIDKMKEEEATTGCDARELKLNQNYQVHASRRTGHVTKDQRLKKAIKNSPTPPNVPLTGLNYLWSIAHALKEIADNERKLENSERNADMNDERCANWNTERNIVRIADWRNNWRTERNANWSVDRKADRSANWSTVRNADK